MIPKFEVGKEYVSQSTHHPCECVHVSETKTGCVYVTMQFKDGSAATKVDVGWSDFREYVPPLKTYTYYVNVYPTGVSQNHSSRDEADKMAGSHRIACQKVTFTEGVFDD